MQTLEFCTLELHLESVELVAKYRQPFDALAVAVASEQERMGEGSPKNGQFENWLPIVDAFRTLVTFPPPAIRAAFLQIQSLENS